MTNFTVRRGCRYRASLRLGLLEQFADNAMIADKLAAAGFTDVQVTGSGADRTAEASWDRDDASAPLPSQVSEIVEVA